MIDALISSVVYHTLPPRAKRRAPGALAVSIKIPTIRALRHKTGLAYVGAMAESHSPEKRHCGSRYTRKMKTSASQTSGAQQVLQDRRSSEERRRYSLRTLYCCLRAPRRSHGRRSADRRFPLLDTFDSGSVSCVLLLMIFSILDAVFTLSLLARGGSELNPVMNYFLGFGTGYFMSVKMLLTALPALLLISTGNLLLFQRIRVHSLLSALVGGYAGLLIYEVALLLASSL